MAGQGTVGLEILAQCPALDAVVVPVSGGGLIGGVATAVKALAPHVRVYRRGAGACSRAIRRACAPGIRCRWSSSARSQTRSSRKCREMCAFRTWRRTPTALRLWRMMISSAP
ncbi:MAG: pyridoxal-phosphate dependent enzyme [Oscillospiraceae bacterium]